MHSIKRQWLVVIVFLMMIMPAHAGIWDGLNQALGTINQTSQTVDNVKRTKDQVDGMTKTQKPKPKPGSKNKKDSEDSGETASGFELTKTTLPIKGEWGNQVTCAGPNSATCQNGMDNIVNCMHQSKGYYYRLVAANLNQRLQTDKDLTKDDKDMLKADIASVTAAIKSDKVVDPDPNEPQRFLSWLSEEEEKEIQQTNIKYINEVRKDCDDRFGGMSRYSK